MSRMRDPRFLETWHIEQNSAIGVLPNTRPALDSMLLEQPCSRESVSAGGGDIVILVTITNPPKV